MNVKVLFFGMLRDLTGAREELIRLEEGARLEDLWRNYEARFPRLRELDGVLAVAVNQEIAGRTQPLQDGDEVALMPPVSGGAPDSPEFFLLTREVIPTPKLADELKAPADGAVVVFEGIVRDLSKGRRTLFLEYEAYEPMAVRKMEEIGRELHSKFDVDRVGLIHRLGRLEIGETSVAIVVTSAHRPAAFDACRHAIDRLKQTVPIWKKEYFQDGSVWAEGEGQTKVLIDSLNP